MSRGASTLALASTSGLWWRIETPKTASTASGHQTKSALAASGTKESEMRAVEKMSLEEKHECLERMLIYVQSAVESEQDEPKEFKKETELRIDFVYTCLKEMLGLSQGKT